MPAILDYSKCNFKETGRCICLENCPVEAFSIQEGKVVCDTEKCIDCQLCGDICENEAVSFE